MLAVSRMTAAFEAATAAALAAAAAEPGPRSNLSVVVASVCTWFVLIACVIAP